MILSRPGGMVARLRAFELVSGEYREAAHVAGDVPFRGERPSAVDIVPSRLVVKLRSR